MADQKTNRLDQTWSGVLQPHFETGTEGVIWTLEEVGPEFWYPAPRPDLGVNGMYKHFEAMHPIENGDRLIVYDPYDGGVLFDSAVDYERGDPEGGAFGFRVSPFNGQYYGGQRGMSIESWANMFFGHFSARITR